MAKGRPDNGARTGARPSWWRQRLVDALPVLALLCLMMLLMALASALGKLGHWLFIHLPEGHYTHLLDPRTFHHHALALPWAIWAVTAAMLVFSRWEAQHPGRPNRRARRAAARAQRQIQAASAPISWRPLGWVSVLSVLMTLMLMRGHTVLTPHTLIHQSVWAWEPDVYAIDRLRCVSRSTSGRGAPRWLLSFGEGQSLSVRGADPVLMQALMARQRLKLSATRCD